MKKTAYPVPVEDKEQELLFQWAAYMQGQHPCLARMYAVPNGGYRHITTASRMKKTGTKAGVPDVMLPYPCGGYHGLYIEMKRVKGGKVSEEQRDWLGYLASVGYAAVVCHGFGEARDAVLKYLQCEEEKRDGCK